MTKYTREWKKKKKWNNRRTKEKEILYVYLKSNKKEKFEKKKFEKREKVEKKK